MLAGEVDGELLLLSLPLRWVTVMGKLKLEQTKKKKLIVFRRLLLFGSFSVGSSSNSKLNCRPMMRIEDSSDIWTTSDLCTVLWMTSLLSERFNSFAGFKAVDLEKSDVHN
eukprot:scaffold1648_cov83-Skeletonema_menzelii.AAC.2